MNLMIKFVKFFLNISISFQNKESPVQVYNNIETTEEYYFQSTKPFHNGDVKNLD